MAGTKTTGRPPGHGHDGDAQRELLRNVLQLNLEVAELTLAGGGVLTEVVAQWLAAQYSLAARQRLETLAGEERLAFLREFVRDWEVLRRGDQTTERLRIERERVALATQRAMFDGKRKIFIGLEALTAYAAEHPEAKAALEELTKLVRHPLDPDEQPGKTPPNPGKSD